MMSNAVTTAKKFSFEEKLFLYEISLIPYFILILFALPVEITITPQWAK